MKHLAFVSLLTICVIAGGFLALPRIKAASGHAPERWVNANLLQVRLNGHWNDVPMMPLADHLCHSGDPRFTPYCE